MYAVFIGGRAVGRSGLLTSDMSAAALFRSRRDAEAAAEELSDWLPPDELDGSEWGEGPEVLEWKRLFRG